MNYVQRIIKSICDEKNIEFHLVSKNWIMVLKKDNEIRYISGYKFGLNNQSSSIVCDDKYALYDTLKLLNLPIIEHNLFFKNYDSSKVEELFEKYNHRVVVKSNMGTCGNEVYYITSIQDLFQCMNQLLVTYPSISLCPFYDIKNEYRTILLNGNVELFYGKQRPIVYGDGKRTIKELLCDFNHHYFSKINDPRLDTILEDGKKYMYDWRHNLSQGSIPFEVTDDSLKNRIQSLARKAYDLLHLKFASVDIIELESGELLILEINSGVMIENYAQSVKDGEKICKGIYSKAIDLMFENK